MHLRNVAIVAVLVLAGCGSVTDERAPESETTMEQTGAPSEQETQATAPPAADAPEESESLGSNGSAVDGAIPEATATEDAGETTEQGDSPEENTAGEHGGAGLQLAPANPGFLIGDEFTVGDRTHKRLVMPDDYNADMFATLVENSKLQVTDDEALEAIVLSTRFASEELATSELAFNYTEEGARQWLDEHSDLFVNPDLVAQALLDTENTNDSLALLYTNNGWDRGTPESTTRFMNLEANILSLQDNGENLIIIQKVTFESRVSGIEGFDGTFTEETELVTTYEMQMVEGDWKIASYNTTWQTNYR